MGEKQRGTTAHTHTRDCALVLANGSERERRRGSTERWERSRRARRGARGRGRGKKERAGRRDASKRDEGRGERVSEEKGEASHGSYSADRSATRVISRECCGRSIRSVVEASFSAVCVAIRRESSFLAGSSFSHEVSHPPGVGVTPPVNRGKESRCTRGE